MFKRTLSITIAATMLLLSLTACGSTPVASSSNPPTVSSAPESSAQNSQADMSQQTPQLPEFNKEETDPRLEDISVDMKVDGALSQAIVTVTNNGDMKFSGTIFVRFYDLNNKLVGSDIIYAEDIAAGNWSYARTSIDSVVGVSMQYRIKDPVFVEGAASDGGTLDNAASTALAEDFELSFGGGGVPEFATSWFKYVTNIEVFSTSTTSYAIISVSSNANQEAIDRIGNTIFGNYAKKYNLGSVQVIDPNGNTVFNKGT